jgi:hypothetical protein
MTRFIDSDDSRLKAGIAAGQYVKSRAGVLDKVIAKVEL